MSDDTITIEKDSDERYLVLRAGTHVADVIWNEDVDASQGKPEISEGKWFLSRVDADDDEELTHADGKDDVDAALAQAQALIAE
jgi:hypothetical protein